MSIDKQILKKLSTFYGFSHYLFDIEFSDQQEEFISGVDKLIQAKIKKNKLKEELSKEEEYFAFMLGIWIKSGRGCGKDFILAIFILYFIFAFRSKSIATAPTGSQLSSILWSEVKKLHSKIKYDCIKSLFIIQNDTVKCSSKGFESFVVARASGNKNSSALSGYHEQFLSIICDEATGIPDEVYEPLEMTLTSEVNFMILIFNPVVLSGYAYNTHEHPELKKQFVRLNWPATESSIVSKDSIERVKKRHGENSNYYRTSILAEWPNESTETIIPISMARYCINRQYDKETEISLNSVKDMPILIGIDPSRSGANGCDTICTVRQGNFIHEFYKPKEQTDSFKMSEEIIDKLFTKYPDFKYCFVESNGLGGPFFDIIKRFDRSRIVGVNVADTNVDEEYLNVRAMLWIRLRDSIISKQLGISTEIERDDVETFISQITDIKQDTSVSRNTGKFKIKIESKKDMQDRGISSPDYGDATILTYFYTNEQLMNRLSKSTQVRNIYSREDTSSWLAEY